MTDREARPPEHQKNVRTVNRDRTVRSSNAYDIAGFCRVSEIGLAIR